MTQNSDHGRDPLVPDERIPGAVYRAASEEPAWNRAHHDVAADRYWGLADYYRSAATREHVKGEAPGDREPSPEGRGAREMSLHLGVFSAPASHYTAADPGYMHSLATTAPALARSPEATETDRSRGWFGYRSSAIMRQAGRGEAEGDRAPSPPLPGSAARKVAHFIKAGAPAASTAHYPPGHMYEHAAAGPSWSRAGLDGDTAFGWPDYKQAAMIREATRGEGGAEALRSAERGMDREAG